MIIVEVGPNIVRIRKALGISQEKLALDAGVSVGRLRDVEHNTANYTRDTLYRITDTLVVPVWLPYILQLEDDVILDILHTTRKKLGLMTQEKSAT